MSAPATIEVRIREFRQLFNSLDATPFPETDLDADAEEFILGWAMEFRSDVPLKLRVHVEQLPSDRQHIEQVKSALRKFFAYRAEMVQRRLRRMLELGRVSLMIGLACLAASVAGAHLIGQLGDNALVAILRESLIIGGWVAMWRPLEILLYDWWPLRQERDVCSRLALADVEVVSAAAADLPHAAGLHNAS
jgi:hypothetical protein